MEVQVVGEFNGWDGSRNPLAPTAGSGVWQAYVADLGAGTAYKFRIRGDDGEWRDKADPMAFRTGLPPETTSVVHRSEHRWTDDEWLAERARAGRPDKQPLSVYEVHLPSWRRNGEQSLGYDELAEQLTDYVSETGFTHVELMPVMEHPFGGSWGYQVTSYYAPTSRLGDPDGFKRLVDRLHNAGIGVILDWVPAHFPKDDFALSRFDGTALYEDPNPTRGEHPDWGTYVFNFGRKEVRNFLVANALFWLQEYHVDGLRVDAVASMIYLDYSREDGQWQPNAHGGRENLEAVGFLQEMNATVYKNVPGAITIAEESTSWPGVTAPTSADGLGFGFKWNMGWMHDSLGYIEHEPAHRVHHHGDLTFSLVYAHSENYVLPISHDEVVHGKGSLLRKMPGDRWQQLANVRAFLAYQWSHPGKQLIFMGQEFAQDAEWAEHRQLDWWLLEHPEHEGVRRLVADLNSSYLSTPALWQRDSDPAGFAWLDANDAGANTLSYLRFDDEGEALACVVNFSAIPRDGYRLALPRPGEWAELINTDAESYGGSGVGNLGVVHASADPHLGQPASATLRVPPLGALWLRPLEPRAQ